jgi:hypothetical protein
MSANPSVTPPPEATPEQPPHPVCAGLACLRSAVPNEKSEAGHARDFAAYHTRLHAALAPLLDERWRGHRFPTQIIPLTYDEACGQSKEKHG